MKNRVKIDIFKTKVVVISKEEVKINIYIENEGRRNPNSKIPRNS